MDNKIKTGNPDNKTININENYEVEYWTETFGIHREQLIKAVKEVGKSAEAVQKYLNK
jgi:hypothetical protein